MNIHRPILASLVGLVFCCALVSVAPAMAEGACPNEAAREEAHSLSLPECRAYEEVTPAYKNGGLFFSYSLGPNADGTADLTFDSFADVNGLEDSYGLPGGWYADARGTGGWETAATPLPASEYQSVYVAGGFGPFMGSSLDQRSTLWAARAKGAPENEVDMYVRRPGGAIEDLGPETPPSTPDREPNETTEASGLDVAPAGKSDDLSRVLIRMKPNFKAGYHFWPFDTTHEEAEVSSLYEFVDAGDRPPLLVGVGDNGKLISDCSTLVGGGPAGGSQNAMSADGETVFFTAQECAGGPPVNELYARVGNGTPAAHTADISEPSAADCSSCDTGAAARRDGVFQGASTDGSKAFFTTSQALLGGDQSRNLYEYDVDAPAGERVLRVSAGEGADAGNRAEVVGLVQVSEDGSHVYFVAAGAMTATPNERGAIAQLGADNLYVFERDARYPQGHLTFIATLAAGDESMWKLRDWSGAERANATPDGRFLVFTSATPHLTPDDTSAAPQAFEYDAETGALVRVSIGQDGYNHDGNTDVAAPTIPPTYYEQENSSPDAYWSGLTVSADGADVFFESTDALTPQAIDDPGGELENIYEYRKGQVYLISDGRDVSGRVHMIATDASGADVFFTTADQLVAQDNDSDTDIYDARVDGGFAAPAASAECSGDECQGPLSAAPVLLSPGSELQAGGGNATATSTLATHAVVVKSSMRAQMLTKALEACRVKHVKAKRVACEAQARRKHGVKPKSKPATRRLK